MLDRQKSKIMSANQLSAGRSAPRLPNRFMHSPVPDNFPQAACVALSLMLLTPAWAGERQQLGGHVPAAAVRSQPVGRLPGSSRLNLAIGLPLRNQAALTSLLEQLYDPASPQYRHYLSPEQFTEKFGPGREDYRKLTEFAKSEALELMTPPPT